METLRVANGLGLMSKPVTQLERDTGFLDHHFLRLLHAFPEALW